MTTASSAIEMIFWSNITVDLLTAPLMSSIGLIVLERLISLVTKENQPTQYYK